MSDTNPAPSLYAAREPIFPKRVSGKFRRLKWIIMLITLGIYYVTPWIRFDRGPNLPDQAVLVDMAGRRFFFFWIEIWPHEFYFVAGLLIMAGLGLFLFTSALGRVWCGYACPQTVWTDLFILVERWIEGDRNARIRLLRQKWDVRKARLRITKWAAWLLIAVATGGAWVFYFADAPTLLHDLVTGQAHPVAYSTIAILTATTFTFGGFMREQVCIYMCPWPRIQGAMMDEQTLTVGYRDWRGEPRGHRRPGSDVAKDGTALGDCIDCNACVNVCPTGIDIRDGQQMECITCALCIDACDEVMAKLGKPRGLIDYLALSDEPHERAGEKPTPVWRHIFRVRTILYTVLWAGFGVAMLVALFMRSDINLSVAPVRNPVYVTLSDGTIRNTYDVRIGNQHGDERAFEISFASDAELALSVEGSDNQIATVAPDATQLVRVYVTAAPGSAAAMTQNTGLTIWATDPQSNERVGKSTVFTGTGQ
ncbi:cytochrome c oxidase accessory protein CcoG [Qingshengfaniella alkalisoli]|uniref:Cytochrome c oxidase accessory protein CcoG n=1 Tax=Qingshengfaniella alkalisoli TaxID=2599296 RepID=A0A5B8J238_9RHOB|nr:cytochrome c oxidase accessory protein CcoG [Qingshengfaniella alkalisoli]QDY71221.1 cytochrome c oxidase accessory protein CcoG [Qingshengfaniella alkalisoli]